MKTILRYIAAQRQVKPVVQMVIADPVDPREAAYDEAFETLAAIAQGPFMPRNETRQIVSANGIVDGWFASPAYDPTIAIADVVKGGYALQADSLQRYANIWDRETAMLDGRAARRTETRIAIHAGRDLSWNWEHNARLQRDHREVYAACVGMAIAYGLSLGGKQRYALSDWDIRPLVRKGIMEGLYAKTKGRFDKRSGLLGMGLAEQEWQAKYAN